MVGDGHPFLQGTSLPPPKKVVALGQQKIYLDQNTPSPRHAIPARPDSQAVHRQERQTTRAEEIDALILRSIRYRAAPSDRRAIGVGERQTIDTGNDEHSELVKLALCDRRNGALDRKLGQEAAC